MKLGFQLRRAFTEIANLARRCINLGYYLVWLIFDPSKFKSIKTSKIKNLLVIFSGATGDTYNTLAIINQLPKYGIKIYYLTNKKSVQFVKNPKITVLDVKTAKEMIKSRKFDAMAVLGLISKDISPGYFSVLKVPYRAGCDLASISSILNGFSVPLTRKVFPKYQSGIIDWIRVFRFLGFKIDRLQFYFTKKGEANSRRFLRRNHISKNERLIFMHAGAGTIAQAKKENKAPSHEWPNARWSELSNKLIEKYNARLIFTGSRAEKETIREIIKKIRNKKRAIDSSGELSIEDIASLMKRGDLLISIDTSMAHIGAQVRIPLIDLFGPFPPKLASPFTEKKKIIFHSEVCNSCRRYACPEGNAICMKAISVNEILDAADYFLVPN